MTTMPTHNGFTVLAERCDECLYGQDTIVNKYRRSELLRSLNENDSYFVCHKATILGVQAACRGDWDRRRCGQLGRISERLNLIRFVPEADLRSLPPDRCNDEGGDE